MHRRAFLEKIGIGAAFALTAACFGACEKDPSTGPVDFTLNLDDSANAALKTPGNYIVRNNVVVARGNDGNYYAATVVCSHEGRTQVTYDRSNNNYYCTAHGARFSLQGAGLNSNGSSGLTVYKTTLSGNSLRIFS